MKKSLLILALTATLVMTTNAQGRWTLNSRAWTTNYWTMLIYDAAHAVVGNFIISDPEHQTTFNRIVPGSDLVFPIGIANKGFDSPADIYGAYHRAFANPFKWIGDYGIGVDASWKGSFVGFYAGAYFKSQEVCFKEYDNIRGFYFQPRGGLVLGDDNSVELGVFYDVLLGAGGEMQGVEKDMLLGGLGLDFSLAHSFTDKISSMITFSMPLHNFFNPDYSAAFKDFDRRVGYIMLTNRIKL